MGAENDRYAQLLEFQQNSKVVSDFVTTDDVRIGGREDTEKTHSIERQIEGKLAEDICKRLGVSAFEQVLITEVEWEFWVSDATADIEYRLEIRCDGHFKKFDYSSAAENFKALLDWLAQKPGSPV